MHAVFYSGGGVKLLAPRAVDSVVTASSSRLTTAASTAFSCEAGSPRSASVSVFSTAVLALSARVSHLLAMAGRARGAKRPCASSCSDRYRSRLSLPQCWIDSPAHMGRSRSSHGSGVYASGQRSPNLWG